MEISRESLSAVLTAIKNGTASVIEAAGSPSKSLQIAPGTEVSGEVLAKQPNGRFLVRVNGEVLDMALPGETRTGVTVKMTYLGDQPRLTFAISSQTVKGSEVNISTASRWLGSIASAPAETSAADSNQNLQRVRLFDTLPADNGAIALKLKETVRRSGLFYESHLQRWSDGSYPLEELLQEPQGRLSKLPQASPEQSAQAQATQNRSTAELSPPPSSTTTTTAAKAETAQPDQSSAASGKVLRPVTSQSEQALASEKPPDAVSDRAVPDAATRKASGAAPAMPDTVNRSPLPPPAITAQGEKPFRANAAIQAEPRGDRPQPDSSSVLLTPPLGPRPEAGDGQKETATIAQAPQKSDQTIAGQMFKEAVVQGKGLGTVPVGAIEEQSIALPVADDAATGGETSEANSSSPGKTVTDTTQTAAQPAKANLPSKTETAQDIVPTPLPKASLATPPDLKPTRAPAITDQAGLTAIKQEPADKSSPQLKEAPDTKTLVPRQPELQPGKQLPLIEPEPPKAESIMVQPREAAPQSAKPPLQFSPPDSQTLPVIRQQLEMLNSGQFVWQGEAWQGQQMKWTIHRDEHQRKAPGARSWDTELRLELPGLGAVAAAITISGNQVRLSVSAADESSAEMMEKHRQRLVDGMESGGLTLVGMEVKHESAP